MYDNNNNNNTTTTTTTNNNNKSGIGRVAVPAPDRATAGGSARR